MTARITRRFKTGSEALHGLAWTTDRDNNGAVVTATGTVFPQAIGLASTWDPALIHQVGVVDWLRFGDADLGRRTRSFSAEVASIAAGGTIEVRLDSPGGRLLGTAQVPATGDVYTYATVTAPLAAASGRHDVYLVFHGSSRISTFAVE